MCVCVCVYICPFAIIWMDLKSIMLSQTCQSDREKQMPYDFIYMWYLENETNEQIKLKQTQI